MKKYRKLFALLALTALLCVLFAGCSSGPSAKGVLSNFTATDLDGNAVDQTALAGAKLTMVNVWATYCQPCLAEMPDLALLADELAADGVQIMGLVSDVVNAEWTLNESGAALAKEIIAMTGADYLHIAPGESLYNLLNQITAVPTTFFVDANGVQVGNVYVGSRSYDDWKQIITDTLALVP